MNKLTLIAVTLFLSLNALADQCAWNNNKISNKAISLLKSTTEVAFLCEPCGEKQATYEDVQSVEKVKVNRGYYQIYINGIERDLAYTFIKDKYGNYVNLGLYSECHPSGVSIALPKTMK